MFEQERFESGKTKSSLFRSPDGPAAGMSRFRVSSPNDPAEIEAERMADSVIGGGIFRSAEGGVDGGGEADLSTLDLAGAGSPLPMDLQSSMEQSFGTNFSDVRVHTGAGADRASRNISARAFTRGRDVYFRSGAYEPDSRQGQHLIAHELAHVAAGDGGIHREGAEEDPKVKNRDRWKLALEVRTEGSGNCLVAANNLLAETGSMQTIAQEIKAGTVGKADLEQKKQRMDEVENGFEMYLSDLPEYMNNFVQAEKELTSEDAAKGDALYIEAQKKLDRVRDAAPLVAAAKQNIEWGIEQAGMKEDPSTGSPFPKTVDNLLSDPACGQFFKAVDDVRKGTAGAEDLAGKSNAAWNDPRNVHMHGDVAESALERADRYIGVGGTAVGAAGFGSDMLSAASDINEEKVGEDNKNKKLESAAKWSGAATGFAGALGDTAGTVTGGMALHNQEAARKKKIQAMQARNEAAGVDTGIGSAGSADHWGRAAVAGQSIGTAGSWIGFGSSVSGLKNNDKNEDIQGKISGFAGVTGDAIGMAADSQKAIEMKQKDEMAKKSIRALGKQLEGTIPATNRTGRNRLIGEVCDRVRGEKFNAGVKPGGAGGLASLIGAAMDPGTGNAANTPGQDDPSKPELTSKQKNLLTSMQALEASRTTNKENMSDARKDALFDAVGALGDIMGLISSFLEGMTGTIVGMLGSLLGLAGTARDAADIVQNGEQERQDARNEERNKKRNACESAMLQMSTLPALSLEGLRTAKQENLPLSSGQLEAAEQYAAVFHMLQTAGVEMTDFLYAIEMGRFGGKEDNGDERGLDKSLQEMYYYLDFTS